MLKLELGIKAVENRIDGMIKKIDTFKRDDMGNEFNAWQTEDMHRERASGEALAAQSGDDRSTA